MPHFLQTSLSPAPDPCKNAFYNCNFLAGWQATHKALITVRVTKNLKQLTFQSPLCMVAFPLLTLSTIYGSLSIPLISSMLGTEGLDLDGLDLTMMVVEVKEAITCPHTVTHGHFCSRIETLIDVSPHLKCWLGRLLSWPGST